MSNRRLVRNSRSRAGGGGFRRADEVFMSGAFASQTVAAVTVTSLEMLGSALNASVDPIGSNELVVTRIHGKIAVQATSASPQMIGFGICSNFRVVQGGAYSAVLPNPVTVDGAKSAQWLWRNELFSWLPTGLSPRLEQLTVNWTGRIILAPGEALFLVSASGAGHNYFSSLRCNVSRIT